MKFYKFNIVWDYIKIGLCAGMSIINKDEENYIRLKFTKKEKELK